MYYEEENLNEETLLSGIQAVYCNRQSYIEAMGKTSQIQSVLTILKLIEEQANKTK